MDRAWIAVLHISARTAEKLQVKHGLDPETVRSWVVCVGGLRGRWDIDDERGRRLFLDVDVDRGRYVVVLYPADDPLGDAWHLGSAYRV